MTADIRTAAQREIESLSEIEKLNRNSGYHSVDLGVAGEIDVDCDESLNMEDVQLALLGVSRDRAE